MVLKITSRRCKTNADDCAKPLMFYHILIQLSFCAWKFPTVFYRLAGELLQKGTTLSKLKIRV